MIHAHKVLAAYGCLAPRLVTGQFDPTAPRGVAVDRQLLPRRRGHLAHPGLPRRRGAARGHEPGALRLAREWVADPADIIRTPGSESNVKEIYDECAELDRDRTTSSSTSSASSATTSCTRLHRAGARRRVRGGAPRAARASRLAAFVSATGSAGTIGRGRLPEGAVRRAHRRGRGARVPDDAPQRLRRAQHPGHRRQARAAHPQRHEHRRGGRVSDRATDELGVLFATPAGRDYLRRPARRAAAVLVALLARSGCRASATSLAAIKTAKQLGLGARRGHRHRRHRRRRDVRQRAAQAVAPRLRRRLRCGRRRPRRSAGTCSAPPPTSCSS